MQNLVILSIAPTPVNHREQTKQTSFEIQQHPSSGLGTAIHKLVIAPNSVIPLSSGRHFGRVLSCALAQSTKYIGRRRNFKSLGVPLSRQVAATAAVVGNNSGAWASSFSRIAELLSSPFVSVRSSARVQALTLPPPPLVDEEEEEEEEKKKKKIAFFVK